MNAPGAGQPSPTNIDPRIEQALENWFTHHPPVGDQASRYELIRTAAKQVAYLLVMLVPGGNDLGRAINLLREMVMLANAAIACRPLEDLPPVPPGVLEMLLARQPK